MNEAKNEAKAEANLHAEVDKALGASKQKVQDLSLKLIVEEKGRRSAEASLKHAKAQVKEQCKKLHYIEIQWKTTKKEATDLREELKKEKEAAQATKEVAEALAQTAYNRGVDETEIRLVDELAKVCRDYYKEVWIEALNLVGVLATSEWRKEENNFYPQDIRVVPSTLPPPSAPRPPRPSSPSPLRSLLLLLRSLRNLAKLAN